MVGVCLVVDDVVVGGEFVVVLINRMFWRPFVVVSIRLAVAATAGSTVVYAWSIAGTTAMLRQRITRRTLVLTHQSSSSSSSWQRRQRQQCRSPLVFMGGYYQEPAPLLPLDDAYDNDTRETKKTGKETTRDKVCLG